MSDGLKCNLKRGHIEVCLMKLQVGKHILLDTGYENIN